MLTAGFFDCTMKKDCRTLRLLVLVLAKLQYLLEILK